MTTRTATVIGATGLIGSRLVDLLRGDEHFSTIRVLTRRPLALEDPKVRVIVVDFADETAFRSGVAGSDSVFCAVGTTQHKVRGDEAAYRKVDYDIPVHAARFCAETGCAHFLLVSSVGANSTSRNFYTRLKGEVEDAVRMMHIPSISIFRPSLLLGKRQESRPGERVAQALMNRFVFLFPSHYKPISASNVARAMIAAAKRNAGGVHISYYREMMKL